MATDAEKIINLTEDNEILENYFRNTIIPQLFVDGDLKLRKYTPPAMKQFNLSNEDLGRSIQDIKDNFRYPTIIDNIKWVIDHKEIFEKEIQTTDMRWYQMNILPYIVQRTNKSNGVIITFVEITERIKDRKEQEALISDHEILLDTISHDIKNPLTSLALNIELMNRSSDIDEEKLRSFLKNIESSVITLKDVIKELTDSRRRQFKYKAEIELLTLENIIEDVRLSLADLILNTNSTIETEINVSKLNFSRRKLRSIIYNLVLNAINYRSPDRTPKVFIKTEKQDGFVVINVKDNGVGIEEDKKEKIFQKYYRVDDAIEGTGVGLYLVNEIVRHAGGKIEVESEPGKGSVFKVFINEK